MCIHGRSTNISDLSHFHQIWSQFMSISDYHGVLSSFPHGECRNHIDEFGEHQCNPSQVVLNSLQQLQRCASYSILQLIIRRGTTSLVGIIPRVRVRRYSLRMGIIIDLKETFRQNHKFLPWNIIFLDGFGNKLLRDALFLSTRIARYTFEYTFAVSQV
jgi:hypothetical protein